MLVKIHNISQTILHLPRFAKQSIVFIVDLILCTLSTWLAFYLRLDEFILIKGAALNAVLFSIVIALPVFWLLGLYRTIFRYSGLSIVLSVSIALLIYGFLYFLVIGVYGILSVPRSIGLIQPMLLFFAVIGVRLFAKYFFSGNYSLKINYEYLQKALVYGAGNSGQQLVSALKNTYEIEVVGFLDDDKNLHGQVLQGKKIFSLSDLNQLIKSKNVSQVFLALPSISRNRRNQILKNLGQYKLAVKTLPSVSDILQGRVFFF